MIKIVKASAGSGKTYTLSHDYIDLLKDRFDYRHILAVTFTNKATAEMKERILRELKKKAEEDEGARQMLTDILHDYSAFSISTIDKFFQRTLKSFAREIGQFADYQIELDRNALIKEAMDRLLDSLTPEDTDILEWLKSNVNYSLSQGHRVDIENNLYEMGARLKSDERLKFEGSEADFSRERLLKLRENCDTIIADFAKDVTSAAQKVQVRYKNSIKELAKFTKEFKPWEVVPYPNKTLSKEAEESEFIQLFSSDRYIWYCTALAIRDMWFSLGLAGEFYDEFDRMVKEKNVMCLDDSNTILEKIIADSEAPFVYEKLGVRYKHFLLDEFQDTSYIQWKNFLPLLRESDAGGNENLIVGDIKQSIYRWRDSDWTLLGQEVQKQFPKAQVIPSRYNWRSLDVVRNFNNEFFNFAANVLGSDSYIYSDVAQAAPPERDTAGGYVKVSFCADQFAKVLESVKSAIDAGARQGDIIVLVRQKIDGYNIAAALMEKDYRVISDDSLRLKSSLIVRKLYALLASHENSDDSISRFLVESEGINFPSEYHSLLDLCEHLLRELYAKDPTSFEGETLFIQAFMDELRDWVGRNGNDLHFFLEHFKNSDSYIGSPDNADSIRVLTVHKAKGLEAPYVIFPYAEKTEMYKRNWHWCKLDVEGTPFEPEVGGIYPVQLSDSAANTLFADALNEEKRQQRIDGINTFYVALTRAAKCLHVIAKEPAKNFRDSLKAGNPEYKDFSQVLYAFTALGVSDAEAGFEREYGSMYNFKKMKRKEEEKAQDFDGTYLSYDFSGRLSNVSEAEEFFDALANPEVDDPRHNGTVLHAILAGVETPEDLRKAVDEAELDGLITIEEGNSAYKLLQARIAAHPEFFSSDATILNEASLISANGEIFRPDRVLLAPDGCVTIIDYKFGKEKPEYIDQVRGYMDLYSQMGYEKVNGIIWYVYQDKLLSL